MFLHYVVLYDGSQGCTWETLRHHSLHWQKYWAVVLSWVQEILAFSSYVSHVLQFKIFKIFWLQPWKDEIHMKCFCFIHIPLYCPPFVKSDTFAITTFHYPFINEQYSSPRFTPISSPSSARSANVFFFSLLGTCTNAIQQAISVRERSGVKQWMTSVGVLLSLLPLVWNLFRKFFAYVTASVYSSADSFLGAPSIGSLNMSRLVQLSLLAFP